jgi:hypothetical protein
VVPFPNPTLSKPKMVAEYVATKLAVRAILRLSDIACACACGGACACAAADDDDDGRCVDVQNPNGVSPSFTELEGYLVGRMIADTLFRMRSR